LSALTKDTGYYEYQFRLYMIASYCGLVSVKKRFTQSHADYPYISLVQIVDLTNHLLIDTRLTTYLSILDSLQSN